MAITSHLSTLNGACAQDDPIVIPSALPAFSYVGKPLSIRITGLDGQFEYRALVKFETEQSWNFDAPWLTTPNLEIIPDKVGLLSIDIQARRAGSESLSLNKWIGQTQVLAPVTTVQLLAWPLARFEMASVQSDLSSVGSRLDWRTEVHSPEDFAAFIHSRTPRTGILREIAPSDEAAFALTAMQIVSGLWHYGNFNNPSATGCIRDNERRPKSKQYVSFSDYLNTSIGCCEDYATIISLILEINNIPNRVVLLESHALNEAFIDGEWWVLDANIGVAYRGSWEKITDGISQVKIYQFSHEGMRLGSRIYSAPLNNMRASIVAQLAAGLMFKFDRYTPNDWVSNYNTEGWIPSGARKITAIK